MHTLLLIQLCIYEVENLVTIVDDLEELRIHALLHGCYEFTRLYEFSYRRLALKSLGNVHFHRARDLLNLSQPVLIDLRLDLRDRGALTHRRYCTLVLRVLED